MRISALGRNDRPMLEERILFVDADAIVIDKPAGLPVDTPRNGGDSIERRVRRGQRPAH